MKRLSTIVGLGPHICSCCHQRLHCFCHRLCIPISNCVVQWLESRIVLGLHSCPCCHECLQRHSNCLCDDLNRTAECSGLHPLLSLALTSAPASKADWIVARHLSMLYTKIVPCRALACSSTKQRLPDACMPASQHNTSGSQHKGKRSREEPWWLVGCAHRSSSTPRNFHQRHVCSTTKMNNRR